MDGTVDIFELERQQGRVIRWMMILSLILHAVVIVAGTFVSSLFPEAVSYPVVTVELMDDPMSTLLEDPPAPPIESASAPEVETAVPKETRATGERKPTTPSPPQWLRKLDDRLAAVADAPVTRKTGRAGGLPVRHWENDASPRPGDFPPAVAPEKNLLLGKQLEDLEDRVRRSGHPGVGVGSEAEASMMFGGTGSAAGEPIPPWIRDMIRRKVRGYLPELEAAYAVALRRNPGLKGKLLIRFRIDASGKIQRAEAMEASFTDAPFTAAIMEKVGHWSFDPTEGRTVEVLYPLVFFVPT